MTKITTNKHGTQRWLHHGYLVEQVGIGYRIWMDFVHAAWSQPTAETQMQVRELIGAVHSLGRVVL